MARATSPAFASMRLAYRWFCRLGLDTSLTTQPFPRTVTCGVLRENSLDSDGGLLRSRSRCCHDALGPAAIKGVYANRQDGYAEEQLAKDDISVVAFYARLDQLAGAQISPVK